MFPIKQTLRKTDREAEGAQGYLMPAGVSKPLPTLMLVMLSFSASRLARRLSGAGVKICTALDSVNLARSDSTACCDFSQSTALNARNIGMV